MPSRCKALWLGTTDPYVVLGTRGCKVQLWFRPRKNKQNKKPVLWADEPAK